MNVWVYSMAAYAGTAVISLLLIGTIVLINKLIGDSGENMEEQY